MSSPSPSPVLPNGRFSRLVLGGGSLPSQRTGKTHGGRWWGRWVRTLAERLDGLGTFLPIQFQPRSAQRGTCARVLLFNIYLFVCVAACGI